MEKKAHYINGGWTSSGGELIFSKNPATNTTVWEGPSATKKEIDAALAAAQQALPKWSFLSVEERIVFLEAFREALSEKKELLAKTISSEMGKPLWESKTEVEAMRNKIAISIDAYNERCPSPHQENNGLTTSTQHRPHGIVAIFGPYNFPAHLPNGHIIPALIAGNTIILKPSEHTPKTAEIMMQCWEKAKIPKGVINLLQGGRETGKLLAQHPEINALFFTGSWQTGHLLQKQFLESPEKLLALEMGGNNPLIIWECQDLDAAAYLTTQSAFLTSGQRCTCARRLIIEENSKLLEPLVAMTKQITVGGFDDSTEPFMGPVVSPEVAKQLLASQQKIIDLGGKPILLMEQSDRGEAFLTPGIIDVTNIEKLPDDELFGPLLQIIRVKNFNDAIRRANQTSYGLSAGIITDNKELFDRVSREVRAGIINWNTPLTGASSAAPFGGVGKSGNYRPSAYYAADYCAYPVASMQKEQATIPDRLPPGFKK